MTQEADTVTAATSRDLARIGTDVGVIKILFFFNPGSGADLANCHSLTFTV